MGYFLAGADSRDKPRVLFSVRRFAGVVRDGGEWVWKTVLVGPFEASGLGVADVFFNDEAYYDLGPKGMNEAFLKLCKENNYDAVCHYWMPHWAQWKLNLDLETLYSIRADFGIPIFSIWFDTWCPSFSLQYKAMLPFYDLTVVTDTLDYIGDTPDLAARCLNLCPPPDTRLFHDPGLVRDIPLSFSGTTGIGRRNEYIEAMTEAGLPLRISGGYNGTPLPLAEYAESIQRTRININFSETFSGQRTLKGRVMETTLCGALLLEEDNKETQRYFTPYEHYVPFNTPDELIERARHFLAHPEEAARIARQGKQRAVELARPEFFWGKILDTLFALDPADTEAARQQIAAVPHVLDALRPHIKTLGTSMDTLRGTRVVIWGTGSMYHNELADWLQRSQHLFEFLGFIDNNPAKWGTTLDGFPVYSAKELAELQAESIVFATWAGEGIINDLFEHRRLFSYYVL